MSRQTIHLAEIAGALIRFGIEVVRRQMIAPGNDDAVQIIRGLNADWVDYVFCAPTPST
jgi:hypothetical protein